MSDLTLEGERLVEGWCAAVRGHQRAHRDLDRADSGLKDAADALGKWLTPGDAAPGETFCVWHGDALIAATVFADHIEIAMRARGKHWQERGRP